MQQIYSGQNDFKKEQFSNLSHLIHTVKVSYDKCKF